MWSILDKRFVPVLILSALIITICYLLGQPTAKQPSETLTGEQILPPSKADYVSMRLEKKKEINNDIVDARPSPRMVELYQSQALQRRAYIRTVIDTKMTSYIDLYNNLAPEVFCPELVRLGTTSDGGKWICSPFRIPSTCNVISLGLANDVTFERELQYATDNRCNIYAYDMDEQLPKTKEILKKIRAKFRVATVSNTTDEAKSVHTIDSLMQLEGVSEFELLKADIEGSEFDIIPLLLHKYKPAQIMIEIHGTPFETASLLRFISHQGYWLFFHEINGAFHNLCEFSFIHEAAFSRYGATPMAKYLN